MFPHVIPHTPPQHCVRINRLMTDAELKLSQRNHKAVASMKSALTRQKRSENNLLGRKRNSDIDQLIRVVWGRSFTVSDLVEKAQLLGLQDINKKAYSRRLATLADKGTIVEIGKVGRETLYQARGAK